MNLKRIEKTKVWEISCTPEELPNVASILQAAAHEGVGASKNGKEFQLNLNGTEVKTSTHIELWMFARGLAVAAAQTAEPAKSEEKIRVDDKETALQEWDSAFADSLKKTLQSLNAEIERRQAGLTTNDTATARADIRSLETVAAKLIEAKSDLKMIPLEAAIDDAANAARNLLEKRQESKT